jgi:GTP-binding protein
VPAAAFALFRAAAASGSNLLLAATMAFIDEAKFFVKAGDGGNGCLSFRREKFVPKGGPDGGDGGDGGSVTIEASRKLASLLDFRFKSHFLAQNGTPGRGKKMYGRKGEDFTLYVPLGSILKDAETGEVLAELLHDGDRFLAARGGEGGKGNVHFASAQNRVPRIATKGKEGEERWLRIELKLLADIGLIGLPNAGKSTLLSKLSAANPKVAPYPFTTLEPQLGVMHLPTTTQHHCGYSWADRGRAYRGRAWSQILRHVERTHILLHVIDASSADEQPLQEYRTLENELRVYNDELMDRQRLVVLNKIDLLEDEQRLGALQELFFKAEGIKPLAISALTGQGLRSCRKCWENAGVTQVGLAKTPPMTMTQSLSITEL